MTGKRLAALAIGVSDATPLPYLGGAVNGARAFHEWASALGYDSRLVTDEAEPVTIDRVREALEALLPDGGTHRFLLYFAGHGVIVEAEKGLWLPSDWNDTLRAIAVESLKHRLARFGVDQVAIFADACRSLPPDMDTAELVEDPVLGRGPGDRLATMAVDRFIAAQDGTRAFMIPGPDPEDDRCLFSGVLLEGLWGTQPAAFSTRAPGKVTSQSLARFLQVQVSDLATRYKVKVTPTATTMFPEDDDVYFGDGPSVTAPAFPPWPPADKVTALQPGGVGGLRGPLGIAPPRSDGTHLEAALRDQERPKWFDTGSGFAIDGGDVVAIWTPPDAIATRDQRPGWWRIGGAKQPWLTRPAPVLIELGTGLVAAATSLPDFIATGLVNEQGLTAFVYREVFAGPNAAPETEVALARLEGGGMRAHDALDLAVELREGKHKDPVRGILAAYLYDAIGDVDSIRRMAFAYVGHDQAIPYDIALLARLSGRLRPDGLLEADVPPVAARQPRTDAEAKVDWTHAATPAVVGVVGGLWPWLRQGWSFLDDPDPDGTTLVLPGLEELATELTPARFTTFHHATGLRLAKLFDLTEHRGG